MSIDPDVIVIGSGLGGLTCAAFLAKAGMKVNVIEQHSCIGGYAHHFNRDGYQFEIGIHSVPMAENGMIFNLLRQLNCATTITTVDHPEMYRCLTPGGPFIMPSGREKIVRKLTDEFPHERENLLSLIAKARRDFDRIAGSIGETADGNIKRDISAEFRGISFQRFIERAISDPSLRNILFSQWPCIGMAPEGAGAVFFSMMFASHLFEGSHHIKGGFSTLADALAAAIVERNGLIMTSCKAVSLVVDAKKVTHVVLESGEEIGAGIVVSNISPYLIHRTLLPENARSNLAIRRLGNLRPSLSAVAVYLGLRQGFAGGIGGNIVHWFSTNDYNRIYRQIGANFEWEPEQMMFIVKKDAEGKDTLTILSLVSGASPHLWSKCKKIFTERIIHQADLIFPGLKENIVTCESATPATFERYTGNTAGALFGFQNTCERYGEAKLPVRFHLDNLYNTGHWGLSGGGVWNVMVNGHRVSKKILEEQG